MKAAAILARLFLCLALVAGGGAATFAQTYSPELKQKAEQGDAKAQFELGSVYWSGNGIDEDKSEGLKWLRLAAERGYDPAISILRRMYRIGNDVVEKNRYKLYIWSALGGMGGSVRNLQAKLKPEKIKEELKKFPSDLQKKAEAAINYFTGYGHEKGDGVLPNYKEAARLYELAAKQGYVKAQYALGLMYLNGKGTAQDYGEAYIWLALAALNADGVRDGETIKEKATKKRKAAEEKLTSEEINQAQAEAAKRLEAIKAAAQ